MSNGVIAIEPGEGGDDAALFARELGRAIARWAGSTMSESSRGVVVPADRQFL